MTPKVALITGAASGIGLACAERYLKEGLYVAGLDLQSSDGWLALAEQYPNTHFFQADVTDPEGQNAWVEAVVDTWGRIDVLVTCAGIGAGGPVHALDLDAWQRTLDINLSGTLYSIKAVLPTMMAQRSGCIITIASVEGLIAAEGASSYNASKAAVVNLSRNVAMDYGRMGIRCNALCQGFISTPLTEQAFAIDMMKPIKEDIIRQTQLGRFGTPAEIAAVAHFLASEDASFITGQTIVADGGYLAGHSHGLTALMGLV